MRPVEEELIKNIQNLETSNHKWDTKYQLERSLLDLSYEQDPYGIFSTEFINHADLSNFIAKETYGDAKNYLMLWLRMEDYFTAKNEAALAQEKLIQIDDALKQCLKKITFLAKAHGTALFPKEIANAQLMRKVYSSNDENLINTFLKYLPAPREKVFLGHALPEIIAKREQASTQAIKNVLARNANDLTSVENKITKAQRRYRAKKRHQETMQRIPFNERDGMKEEEVNQLLKDANTPYMPQCEEQLAKRIMNAAKKLELFSTVRHLTAASALESIFNDGLLGRRSLLQFYLPFRPASLFSTDINNGDANVVCLGANEIDPKANHGIELIFDAKKIAENNPCVFYKQKDLEFGLDKLRSINIGNLKLHFSHTETYRCQSPDVSSLILYREHGGQYAWSAIKKPLLIADNLQKMHQILALNFFRFIDGLSQSDFSEDTHNKNKIYAAFNKLNDEELTKTLLEIGKNMTDSMEFNFYGAYKIDFSALLTIKKEHPFYTLNLPNLVKALKNGDLEILDEAKKNLPEIFNSYRFIDYLLSNTTSEKIIAELQEQREKCFIPSWMQGMSAMRI